jgi:hypothetical protein
LYIAKIQKFPDTAKHFSRKFQRNFDFDLRQLSARKTKKARTMMGGHGGVPCRGLKSQAQSYVFGIGVLLSRVPVGHTTEIHAAVVTATTDYTPRASRRTLRIGLGCCGIVRLKVLTPFIHITTHVVDTQLVTLLGLDGMCLF